MVQLVRTGKEGKWPLTWEVSVDHGTMDQAEVASEFEKLAQELEEIDGVYYRHGVEKEEWDKVMAEVQKVCEEEAGGAVTQFMTCLCFGVMESPSDVSAKRLNKGVLEGVNSPARGKMNRKVVWTASSVNEKVQLQLEPRKGYAKWVEGDREKLRRQESNLRKHKVRNMANTSLAFGKLGLGMAKNALRSKSRKKGLVAKEAPESALETLHNKKLVTEEEYANIKARLEKEEEE